MLNPYLPADKQNIDDIPLDDEDRPEYGKLYALTSAKGPSIANGNTWKESEVKNAK